MSEEFDGIAIRARLKERRAETKQAAGHWDVPLSPEADDDLEAALLRIEELELAAHEHIWGLYDEQTYRCGYEGCVLEWKRYQT